MKKQCVVLGVSGGIAVYKALDVVSSLRKKDVEVHVIMTKSATEFVTPLSFQSLSQNLVTTDMFAEPKAWEIGHISLAKKADIFLVAPATANVIGKVANGIADDMLTTTIMATRAKVVFAPAMNTNMYDNPIVQENIRKLKSLGYEFIEPASGRLACGDQGKGKLASPENIVEKVMMELRMENDLLGKKILISAGPTQAPIDPVRFITNRSTGKMGYSIAREARDRGADVILVTGPSKEVPPQGIEVISVTTNGEMREEIVARFADADIIIKSAAVADYKIKKYSNNKIKKSEGDLVLTFTRDNDILHELGSIKTDKQTLVGFAAESDDIEENALKKLQKKNLDYIVANDISSNECGFGSDDNKVVIFSKDGKRISLNKMNKLEIAKGIFDVIVKKR